MDCMNDKVIDLNNGQFISTAQLLDLITYREEDAVVVAGTLVEGIGTPQSDLDIYVVTDMFRYAADFPRGKYVEIVDRNENAISWENTTTPVYSTYDYLENDGIHIDVKYVTEDSVREIFEKVKRSHVDTIGDDNIFFFNAPIRTSYEDEMMFHRLGNGLQIAGGDRLANLLLVRPLEEFCFTAYCQFSPRPTVVRDVQGAMQAGKFRMAKEAVRALVFNHMRALLHLDGCSNKNGKWLFEYVVRNGINAQLRERFFAFEGLPSRTDNECRLFVGRGLALCDEIFRASRDRIARTPSFQRYAEATLTSLRGGMSSRLKSDRKIAVESDEVRRMAFEVTEHSLVEIAMK